MNLNRNLSPEVINRVYIDPKMAEQLLLQDCLDDESTGLSKTKLKFFEQKRLQQ